MTETGDRAGMENVFSVRGFGAAGDGRGRDDEAFQRAVDACHAAGGGLVLVPPGDYLCATVELRSRVNLHLLPGAVVCACTDEADYRARGRGALFYAENAENVSLTGRGCVHGQGESDQRAPFRPRMVKLVACRDIHIEGVTFLYAPGWTIHLLGCDTAMLRGLSILNNPRLINTDGIDPDCSRNIHISDCRIVAGDDCIVVKTTRAEPCSDVLVTNCTLETTCAALKIGTETLGPISNILFSNCVVRNTRAALAVYVKDGATVENISFNNISIETGRHNEFPLYATVERRFPDSPLGAIRNLFFSNLFIRTRGRCILHGHPEAPLENVVMSNVALTVCEPEDPAAHRPPRGAARVSPETAAVEHPEAPAALHFARVRGLSLNEVSVTRAPGAGAGQALFASDNTEMALRGFRSAPGGPGDAGPAVAIVNCPGALVDGRRHKGA